VRFLGGGEGGTGSSGRRNQDGGKLYQGKAAAWGVPRGGDENSFAISNFLNEEDIVRSKGPRNEPRRKVKLTRVKEKRLNKKKEGGKKERDWYPSQTSRVGGKVRYLPISSRD